MAYTDSELHRLAGWWCWHWQAMFGGARVDSGVFGQLPGCNSSRLADCRMKLALNVARGPARRDLSARKTPTAAPSCLRYSCSAANCATYESLRRWIDSSFCFFLISKKRVLAGNWWINCNYFLLNVFLWALNCLKLLNLYGWICCLEW